MRTGPSRHTGIFKQEGPNILPSRVRQLDVLRQVAIGLDGHEVDQECQDLVPVFRQHHSARFEQRRCLSKHRDGIAALPCDRFISTSACVEMGAMSLLSVSGALPRSQSRTAYDIRR